MNRSELVVVLITEERVTTGRSGTEHVQTLVVLYVVVHFLDAAIGIVVDRLDVDTEVVGQVMELGVDVVPHGLEGSVRTRIVDRELVVCLADPADVFGVTHDSREVSVVRGAVATTLGVVVGSLNHVSYGPESRVRRPP
jgi:chemotaxis signal transduction protein